MRTPHTRIGGGAPLRLPLSALTAMVLAGTAVILPQAAWAEPGDDAPITVSAPGPSEAPMEAPGNSGTAAPSSTAEWTTRNQGLADYARLSTLLESPEPLTWVLAGDSITQGVWHSHGLARFADYFESHLHSEDARNGARMRDTVTNTGVSSATSGDVLNGFDTWVVGHRPHIVVLSVGMNDALKGVDPETYRDNLRSALSRIREQGAIPVLQTQNYTKNTEGFNAKLERYFAVMREVAIESDTVLIDVARFWLERNDGQPINPHLMNDWIHPNERGHLLWAQLLTGALGLLDPESRLARLRPEEVGGFQRLAWADPAAAGERISYAPPADADTALDLDKTFHGEARETISEPAPWMAQAGEATFVVRARLSASEEEGVLLSAADPASTKKVSLKVLPDGQLRVNGNLGDKDGWYTVGGSLRDGQWHTISVTVTDSALRSYADGRALRAVSFAPGAGLAPKGLGATELTIGAEKDVKSPAEHLLVGEVDYAAAYGRALDPGEHAALPGIAASDLAEALAPLVDNSAPNTWLYMGGRTTHGAPSPHSPLSTRGYVQLIDEVLRWEYGDAKGPLVKRTKFAVNRGRAGADSAELLADYRSLDASQRPAVLVLVPEVLDRGRLIETSVDSFTDNITALIAEAKEDGALVILTTPPQLGPEAAPYAEAIRRTAPAQGAHLVDLAAWMKDLKRVYPSLDSLWFSEGMLNHAGQLMLAERLVDQMGITPGADSQVRALEDAYFDKSSPAPMTDPNAPDPEPEEPVKPAYVAAAQAEGAMVLMGDWDGDGVKTYAVRVGTRVVFYTRNEEGAPVHATVSIGRAGDEVLVGDWDGDGSQTLALRRGTTVLTQRLLTSGALRKIEVPGITRASKVEVRHEDGAPDTIVVAD